MEGILLLTTVVLLLLFLLFYQLPALVDFKLTWLLTLNLRFTYFFFCLFFT